MAVGAGVGLRSPGPLCGPFATQGRSHRYSASFKVYAEPVGAALCRDGLRSSPGISNQKKVPTINCM
ncbi:protein of unknown function [Pseudomonas inefficax]|uniref:Uncharacterized protein n=1 Tax=Pseudomonas inefficax TaxID=2078786 RepID=A0AAQ1P9V9_9PSED|nr:protein of unknown function [Pseudomonas inefficax]